MLAQVPRLLYTRFDLAGSRLRRNKVVPRVLQNTYPAEPAHAFPVSTVILNLFFWVVRAGFGEGLWDVLGCWLYTDGEWLL